MPLKAHIVIIIPLSLCVKPAEQSRQTQETETAAGRGQLPTESKSTTREPLEGTSPGSGAGTFTQDHQGRLHD